MSNVDTLRTNNTFNPKSMRDSQESQENEIVTGASILKKASTIMLNARQSQG